VKPDYPLTLADQGWFFVAGRYTHDGATMEGHMYVSYKVPARAKVRHPVVMIHGGAQTGVCYEATPDGREGWADYFVARGFTVYVVDQPARGRGGAVPAQLPSNQLTVPQVEKALTSSPQWPGTGRAGDTVFDQFFATQVRTLRGPEAPIWNQMAGAALLDRIGPAVLLTHSQSGEFGWLIADVRPELVRAIVAIEPAGPPVYRFSDVLWPWGITSAPITYEPSLADVSELNFVCADGWLQSEPARRLPNLSQIPVLLVTGEASYHAAYDHCTVNYLRQAGVDTTWLRLEDEGIHGNGHMMMLELNNLDIARVLVDWIERTIEVEAQA
jgi:pimeloyl-ACP methyl ester carboxylesterase